MFENLRDLLWTTFENRVHKRETAEAFESFYTLMSVMENKRRTTSRKLLLQF